MSHDATSYDQLVRNLSEFTADSSRDGVLALRFTRAKYLDDDVFRAVKQELLSLVSSPERGFNILVLDASGVAFFSSVIIGVTVLLAKAAANANCRFAFAGIRPNVFEVFKITLLDKTYVFGDDVEDAIAKLRRGAQ